MQKIFSGSWGMTLEFVIGLNGYDKEIGWEVWNTPFPKFF